MRYGMCARIEYCVVECCVNVFVENDCSICTYVGLCKFGVCVVLE